jgi:hypothetical protein
MEIISRADATSAGLTHYFTGVSCKHGHLSPRYTRDTKCTACVTDTAKRSTAANAEKVATSRQAYRDANRERLAADTQASRLMNPDKVKAAQRKWRDKPENRAKLNAYSREYHRVNADQITARKRALHHVTYPGRAEKTKAWRHANREKVAATRNKYFTNKKATDPVFKASVKMRAMLRRILTSTGQIKRGSSREMMGYGGEELRVHLESLFQPGMTWDNYGEWHIDHKIPVSMLTMFGICDPAFINALSNLQPMWAIDNLKKGNRSACECKETPLRRGLFTFVTP